VPNRHTWTSNTLSINPIHQSQHPGKLASFRSFTIWLLSALFPSAISLLFSCQTTMPTISLADTLSSEIC